jgi:hypothetical protein
LEQLNRAQTELNARSTDLLTVANDIRREAVADFKVGLVANLVEGQLLPDLHRLASQPLPAPLALVPESMLNWLCRHLDLVQHLQSGQHLEIPAHQLDQYELEGPSPNLAKSLVQVQVLCPGWKWREKLIIPPRVSLAESPAEPATPDAQSLR